MTDAEVMQAALSDPDAQPLTPADAKRMKRVPHAKIIRQALGMSQEQFAEHFGIPVGTLRDWEQGRAEPDQAAQSYLKVIARKPDVVRKALEFGGVAGQESRRARRHWPTRLNNARIIPMVDYTAKLVGRLLT